MMNFTADDFEKKVNFINENEEIESISLHVIGDIKENSICESTKLLVDGMTDSYSSIFSHTAQINVHKGTLRCHHANVKILDGGEIHATTVNVDKCLSGTIFAQDITIENVQENLTIIASNSITIKNISGSHNTFMIDYTQVPIINSKLELITHDLNELQKELEDAKKHNHSIINQLNTKILNFEKEKTAIYESYTTAIITLQNEVPKENQIIFFANGSSFEYTTQVNSYLPFCLSFDNDKITLLPTKGVS